VSYSPSRLSPPGSGLVTALGVRGMVARVARVVGVVAIVVTPSGVLRVGVVVGVVIRPGIVAVLAPRGVAGVGGRIVACRQTTRITTLPRVCIQCCEGVVLAAPLLHTLLVKVPVVDENLVLSGAAERAESEVTALGDAVGRRPGQVGWARVDELDGVVSGVVEASGDGARREPSNLRVLDSTGNRVNVELKGFLADLFEGESAAVSNIH
jgi:hypothetical protein